MSSDQFDDDDPAIVRVSAGFVIQARQQVEDTTLMGGGLS